MVLVFRDLGFMGLKFTTLGCRVLGFRLMLKISQALYSGITVDFLFHGLVGFERLKFEAPSGSVGFQMFMGSPWPFMERQIRSRPSKPLPLTINPTP